MSAVYFTILGPPRTHKNHGWRTKQGKQMPSKAYAAWDKDAQIQLAVVKASREIPRGTFPIQYAVNVKATFWRDAERGDLVGYLQALADTLQHAGIVADDVLIRGWDGSRAFKDAENPRIEVEIRVI